MLILKKKNIILIGLVILFVVLPIMYINIGNYNISSQLNKIEEKEYLQVIYSLSASMIILAYYGIKWLLRKSNLIFISLSVVNLLGIASLILLFQTVEHYLLMDADVYYLIVYSEIVIIHVMHHIFTKMSVV